ncbi:hypothetical protein B0H11DRAFT_2435023 [Mycena galericulata]|nr:hypothetical protein B0H11DRAFT_2435023 [Mycena galericulata]
MPKMLLEVRLSTFFSHIFPRSRGALPGDDVDDALAGAALEESLALLSWLVLNGRTGCSKSVLLLQAAKYAAASSAWLVLYIPRARCLVDAGTPYTYSSAPAPISSPAPPTRPSAASAPLTPTSSASSIPPPPSSSSTAMLDRRGHKGTLLLDVVQAAQDEEGEPAAHACLEDIIREMATQTVLLLLIVIDALKALLLPVPIRRSNPICGRLLVSTFHAFLIHQLTPPARCMPLLPPLCAFTRVLSPAAAEPASASTSASAAWRCYEDYVKHPENVFILFHRKCYKNRTLASTSTSASALSSPPLTRPPSRATLPRQETAPSRPQQKDLAVEGTREGEEARGVAPQLRLSSAALQ